MNGMKIRRGNQEAGGQTAKKRMLFHKDKCKVPRVHSDKQPHECQAGNYGLDKGMQ